MVGDEPPRRPDGYSRIGRAGHWVGTIGGVGVTVAIIWEPPHLWDPPYQGPMTGIGPALTMAGGVCAFIIGGVMIAVSSGLRAIKRSRTPDDQ